MSDMSMVGWSSTLDAALAAGAPVPLTLPAGPALALCTALGAPDCGADATATTILKVSHPAGYELVRVSCESGQPMVIERGLEGTTAQAAPKGSCIEFVGLPSSPCAVVTGICETETALADLADCLQEPLGGNLTNSLTFLTALATGICGQAAVQAALAQCLSDDIVTSITTDGALTGQLIDAILANLTLAQQTQLATYLQDEIVAAVCASPGLQASLGACVADDVLGTIAGDAGLVTQLNGLIVHPAAGVTNVSGTNPIVVTPQAGGALDVSLSIPDVCAALTTAGCVLGGGGGGGGVVTASPLTGAGTAGSPLGLNASALIAALTEAQLDALCAALAGAGCSTLGATAAPDPQAGQYPLGVSAFCDAAPSLNFALSTPNAGNYFVEAWVGGQWQGLGLSFGAGSLMLSTTQPAGSPPGTPAVLGPIADVSFPKVGQITGNTLTSPGYVRIVDGSGTVIVPQQFLSQPTCTP